MSGQREAENVFGFRERREEFVGEGSSTAMTREEEILEPTRASLWVDGEIAACSPCSFAVLGTSSSGQCWRQAAGLDALRVPQSRGLCPLKERAFPGWAGGTGVPEPLWLQF